MRIIYGFDKLPEIKNPVIAVGSFDGVHQGHRLLISQLCEIAATESGESVVVTFDPHPRQLLRGDNRLLTTLDEKLLLLGQTGVDNVIVINFTREFSQLSHQYFIKHHLVEKLHAKIMITGQEHNFGHNRTGNLNSVTEYGIETRRFERYDDISSTQIRTAVESGDMKTASNLLGGIGYLVKTPLTDESKLLPPDGSYLVEINGIKTSMVINRELLNAETKIIRIIDNI